jgi:hypothetical protein
MVKPSLWLGRIIPKRDDWIVLFRYTAVSEPVRLSKQVQLDKRVLAASVEFSQQLSGSGGVLASQIFDVHLPEGELWQPNQIRCYGVPVASGSDAEKKSVSGFDRASWARILVHGPHQKGPQGFLSGPIEQDRSRVQANDQHDQSGDRDLRSRHRLKLPERSL